MDASFDPDYSAFDADDGGDELPTPGRSSRPAAFASAAGPRQSLGELRLLISRDALLANVRWIRSKLRPGVKICAVVKADAYGLGAAAVVDALCHFGPTPDDVPAVDCFAVATIDEAASIAATLIDSDRLPMHVLRPIENVFLGRERGRIEQAIRGKWTLTLGTPAAADDIARVAESIDRVAIVQILIDTGMTRGGCLPAELPALLQKIESRPSLRLTGLFTHFVNGEIDGDPYTIDQLATFHDCTDPIVAAWHARHPARPMARHIANSGGICFTGHAAQFDMVRPGISIYGIDPTGRLSVDRPLRPAMKWLAPLIDVRDVPAGTTVGYNATFVAPHRMRVGLVPAGYADGYPRRLGSGVGTVLVQNKPCSTVGRVSMDLMCVDLTSSPHATVGDDVTLLDADPLSPASVYELARRADTIPYEILCNIGQRVKRVPIDPADS